MVADGPKTGQEALVNSLSTLAEYHWMLFRRLHEQAEKRLGSPGLECPGAWPLAVRFLSRGVHS